MEDQRNWTDASYKTYCTPLRLPLPASLDAGERIQQSVTVSVRGATPVARRQHGNAGRSHVWIGSHAAGTLPEIGLGASAHRRVLSADEQQLLRRLQLAYLRAAVDVVSPNWDAQLADAVGQANALGVNFGAGSGDRR